MTCRMEDLRSKEVISVKDGGRLGFVCDLEVDTGAAAVVALVVYGRARLFGLLGRDPDTVIPWRDIEMIGGDIVLVKCPAPPQSESLLARLWRKLAG
ncbi:YlmC/YmxH family sporulation protein [Acutalibacter sp. 1XD8-33]|uniref:YlmC/YmxH family sporulation protein n=1 Tax=Acutalibacter sp. 1XD8-33 TaxID=2320081 RepID=UPI0018F4DC6A|nr:YlmC/YmxH family sporulation protein [Acutalibacter sp. 1XD8-33]